jgi:protocatechuate 3,4-dioxygenase beta subunit
MRPLIALIGFLFLGSAVLAFIILGRGEPKPVNLTPEAPSSAPSTRAAAELTAPEVVRAPVEEEEAPPREVESEAAGGYTNSLVGLVTDAAGEPVAGAEVMLSQDPMMGEFLGDLFFGVDNEAERGERPKPERRVTGKDGRYAFRSVEPRPNYYLVVSHSKYTMAQEHPVNVGEEGEFAGPDVVLRAGSRLVGSVTNEGGAPISGAEVFTDSAYMLGEEQRSPDRVTARTNDSGRFEMVNVPAGARNVGVLAKGYGQLTKYDFTFAGVETEVIEVDFNLHPGSSIQGRVVDPAGRGVEKVTVRATATTDTTSSTSMATTDETGAFELADLQPGKYMLRVAGSGYRQIAGEGNDAEAGETGVEVRVVPQVTVAGSVVDQSGKPVRDFTCKLQYAEEGSAVFEDAGVQGDFRGRDDGSFELSGINPGSYVVHVDAGGFAPGISRPFVASTEGERVAGLVIHVSAGASMRGRVVDAEGKPVAGALVSTHGNEHAETIYQDALGNLLASNATKRKARSNAEGVFELNRLAPETYQIHVAHARFPKLIRRGVTVGESQELDLGDLKLTPGGSVRGTVRDAAGSIQGGAQVILRSPDGESYSTRCSGKGIYEFDLVRTGPYEISATGGSGKPGKSAVVPIQVSEGKQITQDLQLGG